MKPHPSVNDDIRFYAERFIASRYRGRAHLETDLQRFITAYRVPRDQRPDVFALIDSLIAR